MARNARMSISPSGSGLSAQENWAILKRYDDLPKSCQRNAASILGIPSKLLCKVLNDRYNSANYEKLNLSITLKRKHADKCVQVEDMLLRWLVQARTLCVPVTNAILFDKALSIATQLGIQGFSPTSGWLSRWKSRNNIVFHEPSGEKIIPAITSVKNWMEHFQEDILPRYDVNNVYNMAETGLYFRALPCTTIHLKSINLSECHEYQSHRLTMLLICNMTGSDKKRPLIIGKNHNPKSFRNVKKLPVDYVANSNAWMTSLIFTKFLKEWDKTLEQKKILLLLDSCKAHPEIILQNITLLFLPVDNTVKLPLHQGIINTVKINYRNSICSSILCSYISDDVKNNISPSQMSKNITILEAVHVIAESWEKVAPTVIKNCFRKSGFSLQSSSHPENEEESEDLNLQHFVNIDNDCPSFGPLSESDIVKSYFTDENINPEEITDKYDNDDNDVPTVKEVRRAVETLKVSIQHFGDEETFKLFYKLKANIEKTNYYNIPMINQ